MHVPFGPFLSLGDPLFGSVFAQLPFSAQSGGAAGGGCCPSSSEVLRPGSRLPGSYGLQGFTSVRGRGAVAQQSHSAMPPSVSR